MTPATGPTIPPGIVLQTRGVGLLESLRGGLPAWAVDVFATLTHLGDAWLLLLLAFGVYLLYDRRAGGFVLGTLFIGFAVTIALKAGLALPRPPAGVRAVAASGFGFPSGHALGATVGWGALALVLDRRSTARRRHLAAGVVIVTVALSRVAIGVHYLVDVAAGVALGAAVLGVAARWGRDEPLALFGLAAGVAAIGVALTAAGLEAVALLGGCGGATVGWQLAVPDDRRWRRRGLQAAVGIGVLLAGAVAVVGLRRGLAFGGAALLATGILVVPIARERWLDPRTVTPTDR